MCVIMPAYNEGDVIQGVVRSSLKVFNKSKHSVDVLVVNDGSSDNTEEEARKGGAKIVSHILNTGAGGATATGMNYARKNSYDIAATMDADGQHSPEDVLKGIEKILKSKDDLLIGSRLIDSTGMSRVKVIGNKGLTFITYLLFGINTTDSQSGLRIFSRKALEDLSWTTNGYEFCSEMLWRASQLELKVGEYPVRAIYTEHSLGKGQSNWNAVNVIKSLVKRRLVEIFE